jgi:hypothetical protein
MVAKGIITPPLRNAVLFLCQAQLNLTPEMKGMVETFLQVRENTIYNYNKPNNILFVFRVTGILFKGHPEKKEHM